MKDHQAVQPEALVMVFNKGQNKQAEAVHTNYTQQSHTSYLSGLD